MGLMLDSSVLLVAATSLQLKFALATLNIQGFNRVVGLKLVDLAPFMRQ